MKKMFCDKKRNIRKKINYNIKEKLFAIVEQIKIMLIYEFVLYKIIF